MTKVTVITAEGPVDIIFSFDTTGSMYPCLTQVRREVENAVKRLRAAMPDLRIGIIAHGDYCDKRSTYVVKILPLTSDMEKVCKFIREVSATGGGDSEECYEKVLQDARGLAWRPEARKALCMIGDDVPHSPEEARRQGGVRIDWREELKGLLAGGIAVYAVQALNRSWATSFYSEIARVTGGFHLKLNQFSQAVDTLLAIGYKQVSDERVEQFSAEVAESGRMDRNLFGLFEVLLGRAPADAPITPISGGRSRGGKRITSALASAAGLNTVDPARFQVLNVDGRCSIRDFVEAQGLAFKTGRGFYEFTKPETIQHYKEVVLRDRETGDMFSGVEARRLIGLPEGTTTKLRPTALEKYRVFVQSTSYNRVLMPGTGFLYEVEDWDKISAAAA